MDLGLGGRVALITGAARGIGLAVARALLREGARVAITSRDPAALRDAADALAGSGDLLTIETDAGTEQGIATAIDAVGRWDAPELVVANIGSGRGMLGLEATDGEWQRMLETNCLTAERLARATLPTMVERRRGSMVFVASIAGREALSAPLAYGAAKAAVIHLARSLARLVGPSGVRVNSVAPGNVLFEGGSWERHLRERRAEVEGYIEREVPLRRFGSPEEIANAITFLLSPRASFITGACLAVDGGQLRSVP